MRERRWQAPSVLDQVARGGGRPAAADADLTDRQRDVQGLLAAGHSNPEIARELFIVLSTVKTHVQNIYRKLGARNRGQAVSKARELNLL